MKFVFSAKIDSPSARSVFHFRAKEIGAQPEFDKGKIIVKYEGTPTDPILVELLKLYEAEPNHLITIST